MAACFCWWQKPMRGLRIAASLNPSRSGLEKSNNPRAFGRFLIKVLAFAVVAANFAREHESTSEYFYRH